MHAGQDGNCGAWEARFGNLSSLIRTRSQHFRECMTLIVLNTLMEMVCVPW